MRNKIFFWITTCLLILIVAYVMVTTVLMPVLTKNPLPAAIVKSSIEKKKLNKIDNSKIKDNDTSPDSSVAIKGQESKTNLFDLRKREILLQSRLELANEDSMYLVLDLVNNLVILEMKGIALHECRIIHSGISNSIKMYHTEALLNWMSEPFNVKHIDATIPKIVFVEKIAPKDTIEAAKIQAEPVAAKLGDIYLVMDFDRNLRLVISQNEKPDDEGRKLINDVRWKYQRIEIGRSINSLVKFNRQPAMPQINIVIPKSDATIIYKALPLYPKMILRM